MSDTEVVQEQEDTPPDPMDMLDPHIQKEVSGWKASGMKVHLAFIGDKGYFFRTLNVLEWRKVQKTQEDLSQTEGVTPARLQNTLYETLATFASIATLDTDENGKQILLPPVDKENIRTQDAGVPPTLGNEIMKWSGFDENPLVFKL